MQRINARRVNARVFLFIGAMALGGLPAFAQTLPEPSDDNQPTAGDYPRASMEGKEKGDAIIAVLVKADGKIGQTKVKTSSGAPRLDNAAMRMIKNRFHYKPGMKDGVPADVWVVQPISFAVIPQTISTDKCAPPACDSGGEDSSFSITIGMPELLNP